jgi:hypothetical protein
LKSVFLLVVVIVIVLIVFIVLSMSLPLLLLLSPLSSLYIDPIVTVAKVLPHATAGNAENHGDICPAAGLVRVGETKVPVDAEG